MTDKPIVFSMTEFAQFDRCHKLFELSAIRQLSPKRDNAAVAKGARFHALMADAVVSQGLFHLDEDPEDEMLPVAQAYLKARPLPKCVIAAEKGFFAEVAPGIYIRASFDLVYMDGDQLVIRDYKTFSKAPSFDNDMDFQAKAYLFVAERALGAKHARFEWEYVRSELGRMLKKGDKAVYTPWDEEDRYLQPMPLELMELEREAIEHDLYDLAQDIRMTMQKGYYRRKGQKSGGYADCARCFYKDLCYAEYQQGSLDEQTISLLTQPSDASDRVHIETMCEDPRVEWYNYTHGLSTAEAIRAVYGITGFERYSRYREEAK